MNVKNALWLVSLLSLALAAASLGLWLRTPKGDQHQLELRDEAGRVRIRLVATGGAPRIDLLDEQQQVRARLVQATRDTSLRLFREGSDEKGIDLIVTNGTDGPSSSATVSLYSPGAHQSAVISASDEAWMALLNGTGRIEMRQYPDRSEMGAAYLGNSAKLDVSATESKFETWKPFSANVPAKSEPAAP